MHLTALTVHHILSFKSKIGIVLLALILAKLAAFGAPFLLKIITEKFNNSNFENSLYQLSLATLLIAYGLANLTSLIFNEIKEYLGAKISHQIISEIGVKIFEKMQSLPMQFWLIKQSGVLARELDRGIRALQLLISIAIHSAIPSAIEFILVLIYFFFNFDSKFSFTLLCTLIIYIGYTLYITDKLAVKRNKLNEIDSNMNQKLMDSLLNIDNVKLFNNERYEKYKFNELTKSHLEALNITYKFYSILSIGQQIIVATGACTILWWTISGIENQTLPIGDLILVSTLTMQVFLPLGALGVLYKDAKQSSVDIQKLHEIISYTTKENDENKPKFIIKNPESGISIFFNKVNFHHSFERKILNDITFKISSGETVALVGPSGSGKSTIIKLLFRLYEPTTGNIIFDNQLINRLQIDSIRTNIAIVPQDITLFNNTIKYNIWYGNFNLAIDDIVESAKKAQIHDFILSLPDQYETIVGERGLMLSGGERQRLGIARALIKRPKLLILDEATSSLDTKTEHNLLESLKSINRSMTTLIIAHRLSTIVDVDKIIVIDSGKVSEIGTHDALIKENGIYANLWKQQIK